MIVGEDIKYQLVTHMDKPCLETDVLISNRHRRAIDATDPCAVSSETFYHIFFVDLDFLMSIPYL